ncbi:HD-GYP domain-containing protein [Occallatibacter riparius]|uniref:HD-GYP domain-containing protein n=1 Tax=Occallatibacter riparius TaxID=1002689 RepID=A0A9J7BXQ5_9BACT|nr:HD-GYP domain-containing protein [Occallatibacter riparius]UWZ86005.1 HD-GYP domain-containing protein [Occallatibacter riparius]
MKTHLGTRAFLLCFLPFALLLMGSFWIVQRFVASTVRASVRAELRSQQEAIAAAHTKAALENSRFLKIAGENTALKAGMILLRTYPNNGSAQRTVEDQLREMGERMGFDFMLVSGPDGAAMAGVLRQAGHLAPLRLPDLQVNDSGLLSVEGRLLRIGSVSIDENDENIGRLTVGEAFQLNDLTAPAVLVRRGKVLASNIPQPARADMEAALAPCSMRSECEVRIAGDNWISLPMESYGDGFTLMSLANADAASEPIEARLRRVFSLFAVACLLVGLLCSVGSSRSIVKPIGAVVGHLHRAASTGALTEVKSQPSSVIEIDELTEIYNRAAISVRDSGQKLESAYLEFVGSLASALDARDPYTAGHSRRVSNLSCAAAAKLGLSEEIIERIRIGALLHDIGKIGIADTVLQKPGRLTAEEFALVKQHPVIGRRILEGVQGFAPFLAAVEFHHENWDGSGYPLGLRGEETPLDARIIHVADAYDAMTTDRSYRSGMSHESAIAELVKNAGVQFDPAIVAVFVLQHWDLNRPASALPSAPSAGQELEAVI